MLLLINQPEVGASGGASGGQGGAVVGEEKEEGKEEVHHRDGWQSKKTLLPHKQLDKDAQRSAAVQS